MTPSNPLPPTSTDWGLVGATAAAAAAVVLAFWAGLHFAGTRL